MKPGIEVLSLDEELLLLKYYASKLQHVCRELRLPRRVLGTALTYLKRIYLSCSCPVIYLRGAMLPPYFSSSSNPTRKTSR